MSMKLRELIKRVRGCKTAEEEREVINKESADIRLMSKDIKDDKLKIRSLTKCIYIHMLGYPTNFIQMTCVNLLQSQKFTEKRIAYMALCILVDEKSEVLLLTSNSIKKDLAGTNHFIVSVALNAIGEICTPDLCRDLSIEVVKLMGHSNQYIKKKAALAATRIIKRCPDLLESYADKLGIYLDDKNHGVLLAGIQLSIQVFKQDNSYIEKYKRFMPGILKYLRNLVNTNYSAEFDINGVTDPFLQVKLLEILLFFGKGSRKLSDDMTEYLAAVASTTDTSKNTGNAVLYELVKTIIAIESGPSLKALGSNIIGRFLAHRDNNYKYIALNTLIELAKTEINSVQKHKNTILECLKDDDISIQRRSLDLVYIIVNTSNIKHIVKECLNYLLVAENDLKLEITSKMCQALEKYSPSLKWQLDISIKMLSLAGSYVSEETTSSIINLIVSTPDLHLYAVHKLYLIIKNNLAQEGLVKVTLYILGEFANILVSNQVENGDEEPISVTQDDVIELFQSILNRKYSNTSVHEYLLNALMKMSVKLPSQVGNIRLMIEDQKKSYFSEIQQRAIEYSVFSGLKDIDLKIKIAENVPNSKIVRENSIKKEITDLDFQDEEEENKKLVVVFQHGRAIINDALVGEEKQTKPKGNPNLLDMENIFQQQSIDPTWQNNNQPEGSGASGMFESIFSNISLTKNEPQTQINNSSTTTNTMDIFSQISSAYNMTPQTTSSGGDLLSMTGTLSGGSTTNTNSNVNMNLMNFDSSIAYQPEIKQIFTNGDISISISTKKLDTDSFQTMIYCSNLIMQELENIKLVLSSIKYVTLKVVSNEGTNLAPMQAKGIKKELSLFNQQPDKKVIFKIKLTYLVGGVEKSESITVDDIFTE